MTVNRALRSIRRLSPRHRNRGVALFVSLVFLLVLTIIGVSAVQTTTLETRMARNEHDRLLAFQAAESALRDAETVLQGINNTTMFTSGGSGGMWTVAALNNPDHWEVPGNWTGSGSVVAGTSVGATVAQPPRFMIEHVASVIREENAYQLVDPYGNNVSDRIEMFRITALGTGGNANTQVMLQTTFGRILN